MKALTLDDIYKANEKLRSYSILVYPNQIEHSGENCYEFEKSVDIWKYKGVFYVDEIIEIDKDKFDQRQIGSFDNIDDACDFLVEKIEDAHAKKSSFRFDFEKKQLDECRFDVIERGLNMFFDNISLKFDIPKFEVKIGTYNDNKEDFVYVDVFKGERDAK